MRFIAGIDPLTGQFYNHDRSLDRFTVQWWGRFAHEPTPIYDALVAEVLDQHERAADVYYQTGNLPGYARWITLVDRIRQRVVPPWTRLDPS